MLRDRGGPTSGLDSHCGVVIPTLSLKRLGLVSGLQHLSAWKVSKPFSQVCCSSSVWEREDAFLAGFLWVATRDRSSQIRPRHQHILDTCPTESTPSYNNLSPCQIGSASGANVRAVLGSSHHLKQKQHLPWVMTAVELWLWAAIPLREAVVSSCMAPAWCSLFCFTGSFQEALLVCL